MARQAGFSVKNVIIYFSLLVVMVCLSACKTELYSNLDEKEINEMLAILNRNGITCEKMPGEDATWKLLTQEEEMAKAVEVLSRKGYPKDQFQTMGNIFKRDGLISSPLEERIRYIYALSQEVSATIAKIDGVLSARVHIVLPDNDPLSEKFTPSSASVFIKYEPNANIESSVLKIKELVVNSIEGLEYKKVSVALFPAMEGLNLPEGGGNRYVRILGVKIAPGSAILFRVIIVVQFLLLLIALAVIVYLYSKRRTVTGPDRTPLMQNLSERIMRSKPHDA